MLLCRWSWLVLQFPFLPDTLSSLWGSFRVHQLLLVLPLTSCSIDLLIFLQGPSTCHLLLSLLFNFQIYTWFITILHRVFTQNLQLGKVVIICIFCSIITFLLYISNNIDSNLLRRLEVSQNAIFVAWTVRYFVNIPFLIIHWTLTNNDKVVVLWCHIFSISISRFLYLLILLYYLTVMLLLSVNTDISIRKHVFLLDSLISISCLSLFFYQFWQKSSWE